MSMRDSTDYVTIAGGRGGGEEAGDRMMMSMQTSRDREKEGGIAGFGNLESETVVSRSQLRETRTLRELDRRVDDTRSCRSLDRTRGRARTILPSKTRSPGET